MHRYRYMITSLRDGREETRLVVPENRPGTGIAQSGKDA